MDRNWILASEVWNISFCLGVPWGFIANKREPMDKIDQALETRKSFLKHRMSNKIEMLIRLTPTKNSEGEKGLPPKKSFRLRSKWGPTTMNARLAAPASGEGKNFSYGTIRLFFRSSCDIPPASLLLVFRVFPLHFGPFRSFLNRKCLALILSPNSKGRNAFNSGAAVFSPAFLYLCVLFLTLD